MYIVIDHHAAAAFKSADVFWVFFSFHKMKVGTQQMVCLADEYEPLLSPSAVILQTAAGNIEEKEGHQLKLRNLNRNAGFSRMIYCVAFV